MCVQVNNETRFKLLIWQCGFSALTIVYVHSTSAHSDRGVRLWNTLNLCTSLVGVICRLEAKGGAKNTRSSNVIYNYKIAYIARLDFLRLINSADDDIYSHLVQKLCECVP